eukprot:192967_1
MGVSSRLNNENQVFSNWFISICVCFPFLFLIYYSIKAIKIMHSIPKEFKQNGAHKLRIQKLKNRAFIFNGMDDRIDSENISKEKAESTVEMAVTHKHKENVKSDSDTENEFKITAIAQKAKHQSTESMIERQLAELENKNENENELKSNIDEVFVEKKGKNGKKGKETTIIYKNNSLDKLDEDEQIMDDRMDDDVQEVSDSP